MYVAFSLFNCTDLMESVILYVGILIVAYTQTYAAIISIKYYNQILYILYNYTLISP